MIIYFDLRRTPLFHSMFERSGVIHQNHFKSVPAMYALLLPLVRRLPDGAFYSRPRFTPDDNQIIIFDSLTSVRHLRWLREEYPDKQIILWCWNRVPSAEWLRRIPPGISVWSFSRADCQAYGLRYNTQFFFDCLADGAAACRRSSLPSDPPTALFVGRDKSRADVLGSLGSQLKAAGVRVDLRIIPPARGVFRHMIEKLIPYDAVIELVKNADVLLDYANGGSSGLSLRCMEALFYQKKLITNNAEILEADFYDPMNIYVLGRDQRSFDEFLKAPYAPVPSGIRDRYLLSNWLRRFDSEGEPL